MFTATDRPARILLPRGGLGRAGHPDPLAHLFTTVTAPEYVWRSGHRVILTSRADYSPSPAINSFSTNDTHFKRSELDVYGLEPFGPEQHFEAAFSRDATIMAILARGAYQEAWPRECKKLALYDVATGKLRLKKRPLARGVG